MQDRRQREVQDRLGYLQQRIQEADDPDERAQALAEAMALSNEHYVQQLSAWNEWKGQQLRERGLDPYDPRFNRRYSPGQAGLAEFQADLVAAENDKLRRELTEAKKAADPASIAELVKREVARRLALTGADTVDLGEPAERTDDADAQERDIQLLQTNRMSPQAYLKKWGGK